MSEGRVAARVEWVVAYYDATRTTPEKLLERLKKNGCEKATQQVAAAVEKDKTKIQAQNAIAVPGDFIVISLEGFKKALEVTAPKGWTVEVREAGRVVVQTPAKEKAGKYDLKVGEAEIAVELVPIVK